MTAMTFKKQYNKLGFEVFPTVRNSRHIAKPDELVTVEVKEEDDDPSGPGYHTVILGDAWVVAKESYRVSDFPESLLKFDTGSDTYEEAVESIKEFYPEDVENNSLLWVYWLSWEERKFGNW